MKRASRPNHIPFYLLQKITNGFSEELGRGSYGQVYKGVLEDGKIIAVKRLYPMLGVNDEQFEKELFNNLRAVHHKNIVGLVGYCSETRQEVAEHNGKMVLAEESVRALCFDYMPNGSLDKHLDDEHNGLDWYKRYGIIKGICQGLKYLHEESNPHIYHLDLKPANVLLDEHMLPKLADFGLSRFFTENKTQITKNLTGTIGYMPPEFLQNIISNKFDIFSLGVIIIKLMAGPHGYTKSAEIPSQQFIDLVQENWRKRLQVTPEYVRHLDAYSEQVKICMTIALKCVDCDRHKRPEIGDIVHELHKTETMLPFPNMSINKEVSSVDQVCTGPSTGSGIRLLDVHPLQLRFPFEPNKLISCPLCLTNNTDENYVAFRCAPKTPKAYFNKLSRLCGIVPPRSTCAYVVTMEQQNQQPTDMEALTITVQSCIGKEGMREQDVDDSLFNRDTNQIGGKVQVVTLMVVCDPEGEATMSQVRLD